MKVRSLGHYNDRAGELVVQGLIALLIGWIGGIGTSWPAAATSSYATQAQIASLQRQITHLQDRIGNYPANPNISGLLLGTVNYINCLEQSTALTPDVLQTCAP